jgi:PPP family 3-phenylpropionic acid transporter
MNSPPSGQTLTPPIRLALFYAAAFAVSGVHQPFWPVWLKAHGQDPSAIVVLLSAGVFVRILTNPLVAHLADRRGERRRLMIWLAWGSLAAFALFAVTTDFGWLLALSILFGCLWAPIGPLGDNLALLTAYAEKLDYGRIRRWGSISFMLCTALAGWLIARRGADVVLLLVLACLLVHALVCHLLPDRRVEAAEPIGGGPARRLLRTPLFLFFVIGTSLLQASHAVYYSFFTLHLRRIGFDEGISGLLWSEGVVAEIVLFSAGNLVRRISPTNLMLIGAVAGMIRWPLTVEATTLGALIPLQLLHAFTFGAAHLGAMHFLSRAVPAGLSASAQSLYSALTGAGLGLALLVAGPLYESFGGGAFYAMGLMALAGGLCCLAVARRWNGQEIVARAQ